MSTSSIAAAGYNAAGSSTGAAPAAVSADVAAKVQRALAPAAAGVKQLNTALTSGQARLSGLGKVQSAIGDFQAMAKTLSASAPAGAAATPAGAAPTPADIGSKIQAFANGFNTLGGKLQALQKADLKSDPGLAQVTAQLAQVVRNAAGSLAKAGISVDAGGNMKIDAAKLSAAIQADPAAVAGTLSGNGGGSGRGVLDQLTGKLAALATPNGTIGRETASVTRDVGALETKKATLAKALGVQATALAALYTQQAQSHTGTPTSLFDMLA